MSDTNVAKTDARSTEAERTETGVMLPPVDVIEDALGITLYADLPGVPKDKLHVRIDADALTIEGEVSLPLAGNLDIVAGVTAKLTGWGAWNGKYIVEQAAHSVGSSGYTTQVKLRKTLEGY